MNALIRNKHLKVRERYGDTNWTWEYNPEYVEQPREKKKKDKEESDGTV